MVCSEGRGAASKKTIATVVNEEDALFVWIGEVGFGGSTIKFSDEVLVRSVELATVVVVWG